MKTKHDGQTRFTGRKCPMCGNDILVTDGVYRCATAACAVAGYGTLALEQGAKHTPGPWEIDAEGLVRAKCGLICDPDVDGRNRAEVDANTRLIASAPDLLEALELLVYGAKQACRNGLVQPQVNGGLIMAEAAIAKATQPSKV